MHSLWRFYSLVEISKQGKVRGMTTRFEFFGEKSIVFASVIRFCELFRTLWRCFDRLECSAWQGKALRVPRAVNAVDGSPRACKLGILNRKKFPAQNLCAQFAPDQFSGLA